MKNCLTRAHRSLLQRLLPIAPVVFSLLLINDSIAQNTLNLAGLTASTPASVAYSTRRLSSSYAGAALRVRRSSDNTILDIGFTAGGHLDTVALKTFVGSGNGFIATWYDQSGNGTHLTQTTLLQQPALVASGVIQRENNKPFIRFWGVVAVSHHSLNLPSNMTTVGHLSSVIRFVPGADGFILSSGGTYRWHSDGPAALLIHSTYATASVKTGLAWRDGNAVAPTSFPWPTALTIAEFAPATPSSGTDWNNLGNDRSCCHYLTGGSGYSELIIFNTALPAADRQSLENNQKNYFAIGITLPVTWLSFAVTKTNNGVNIKWQTAQEENTKEFTVQRSFNGSTWTDIATLVAAGNSNEIRDYQFLDQTSLSGIQYYRILQKDVDGKTNLSEIKRVQLESQREAYSILTKPVINGELLIKVNRPTDFSLYNSTGHLLWIKHLNAGLQSVDVRNYAKGIYFVKANDQTKKILLQ